MATKSHQLQALLSLFLPFKIIFETDDFVKWIKKEL